MSSDEGPPLDVRVAILLGKPSFRRRLEAYYSVVSPDVLTENERDKAHSWSSRFEQIWAKFGGSVEGESRLGKKLSQKYGTSLRFAEAADASSSSSAQEQGPGATGFVNPESFYDVDDDQQGSGIISFTSAHFDARALLSASTTIEFVSQVNNLDVRYGCVFNLVDLPVLDRVDQFRSFLPSDDPMHIELVQASTRSKASGIAAKVDSSKKGPTPPRCYADIVEATTAFLTPASSSPTQDRIPAGPTAVLYRLFIQQASDKSRARARVRVLVRYANGIRGTLTGYLMAYDKHFNMLLRDVEEVYTPAPAANSNLEPTDALDVLSNMEVELERRRSALSGGKRPKWTVRRRHLPQIMVRGDIVVLVYPAESEQSAWLVPDGAATLAPAESQPGNSDQGLPPLLLQSRYRTTSLRTNLPINERIGSSLSIVHASSNFAPTPQRKAARENYPRRER
jgi:small nuclear ribonucleoprotein (snRNP)-like protein